MRATSVSCERTRALVSCELDGRAHDLERRFLDAHLARCAECAAFAEETHWFTQVIRMTPLESPRPVALPRRRRRLQPRTAASAAAAAVMLVVAGNVAMNVPDDRFEQAFVASALSEGPLGSESIRSLRRADLASGRLSLASAPVDAGIGAMKPALPAAG